ncbi:MAG TPA: four helix bundle protein [Verrucomicrobiae bacterium]|nr:four helix bundle protein [Verrucomicrobiae bacterium]
MTKEIRISNCRNRLGAAEDMFWGEAHPAGAFELHDGTDNGKPVFDLEERTAQFGEAIIQFAKKIPQSPVNNRLIGQLVGAGTSVGANYCEADDGVSRRDFRNKIGTCRKEARETKFFLRMVATAEPGLKPEARVLWQEAKELHLIFSSIWRK